MPSVAAPSKIVRSSAVTACQFRLLTANTRSSGRFSPETVAHRSTLVPVITVFFELRAENRDRSVDGSSTRVVRPLRFGRGLPAGRIDGLAEQQATAKATRVDSGSPRPHDGTDREAAPGVCRVLFPS